MQKTVKQVWKCWLAVLGVAVGVSSALAFAPAREGLVEFHGRQGSIVATGKTEGTVPIAAMSGVNGAYGIGPVKVSTARSPSSRAGLT